MSSKRCLTVLIIAVLVMASVFQSQAAYVTDMRSNSESDKTRIVIELDGPAQYQAHYTPEPGISVCLLETGLKLTRKAISMGGGLVKAAALNRAMDNTVELNISLQSGAAFTVFPLESPDRIVVDVMSGPAAANAQPLSVAISDPETTTGNPPEAPEAPKHESIETSGQSLRTRADVSPTPASVFPLQNMDYVLVQLCFNVFLVIALMIIVIKLWHVTRLSKKNLKSIKEGANFANIVSGLQMGAEKKSNGLEEQAALPVMPGVSGKAQKRRKRKRMAIQPTADQKQYEKVYKLAQRGMDRMEISQQSNVPIGEVNLILDLTKSRAQA